VRWHQLRIRNDERNW